MDVKGYLDKWRRSVEHSLEDALPPRRPDPGRMVEAMRYTLFLPGKRIRGIICHAVGELFGGREKDLAALAVAVEMVHAASLILDDLPAFDDARRRRGAATNHLVFGESTAILAAVGLLNAGYRHLAACGRPRWIGRDECVLSLRHLAGAVGESGMLAGEALDLGARGLAPDLEELEEIHAMKTGSLFIACAVESARLSGAGPAEQAALKAYAKNLGLAFQITDDLLDVVGDPERTGKDIGADAEGPNFVTYAGVEGAQRLADELIDTAVAALSPLGKRAEILTGIARFVGKRDR